MDFTNELLMERQREIEADMVSLGRERYEAQFQKALEKGEFGNTYPGSTLVKLTVEKFSEAIDEWKNEALGGGRGRKNRAAKSIEFMDSKEVAYVASKFILGRVTLSRSLTSMALVVGKGIMDEARFQHFFEKAPGLYTTIEKTGRKNAYDLERRRKVLIYSMNKFEVGGFEEWTKHQRLQLGVKLIEMFEAVTGFILITKEPARGGGYIHVVRPTEQLLAFIHERNEVGSMMRPTFLPCIVPPKKWTGLHGGGYHTDLISNRKLIQLNRDNVAKVKRAPHMPAVFDGLNAIQETPWKVNEQVLSVLSHLWYNDMDIPGIPSRENIKVPPFPEGCTEEQKSAWKKRARDIHDANAKSRGKRVLITMTINSAEKMKAEDAIFFPHFLDFRGRCYSTPYGLTPQGSDYSKALLTLRRGKPLGDFDAVRWLAIHGANVWGEDKVSLEDRVQWVYDHEEEILWSAEDPIKFDWWHGADKPFCFLAFCYEWMGYKRAGLDFVSHLPIALDGTCNGLQHYAAMLRDEVSGKAVNLVPSDKPQDIYQEVADYVNHVLSTRTFTDGKEALWAEAWHAFGINRKITKRPVMVLPYGGTFMSCVEYVGEAVRERMRESGDPFGDDQPKAIGFLAKLVWEGIGETVVAARQAMSWLQKAARVCSKANIHIEWTTPTGFLVKQKYVDQRSRRVRTRLFGDMTYLSFRENTDKISASKQSLAVSPNFVHSLDASAMMLTIDKALSEGIHDFAMIHDSYGTLAADTPRLAELIREAFVEMYSRNDVLEEFLNDIKDRLPEEFHKDLPPLPCKGTLNIQDVLRSDFFFS